MKKRISSLILAFSILLSIVPLGVLTTFAQDTILYGDADGNGKVDMSDVNLMERYIDGDAEAINGIRFTEADVNVDEVVDEVDLALVKEYLAGNIQLTDDLCTVSFDTNGGEALEPIRVGRNYAIMQEIPSPGKEGEIFIGWKTADGADFYQTEPVTGDMTLYAQYVPVESAEQVYIDSFALTDQRTDLEIGITAPDKTADQVKQAITLLAKDGSDPVDLVVVDNGGGFTVRADGGFRAGGTYELTLGDGLTFTGRDARYRTVALTFAKEEKDAIAFDPDVVFIQDTDDYSYYINVPDSGRERVPVLEIPIYADGSAEVTTGSMHINTTPVPDDIPAFDTYLEVGDIVCVYENVDPRQRDYTQDLYEDDSIAYIRVTAVNVSWAFQFESLSEEDMDEVVFMPDTIPYQVDTLPSGGAGTAGTVDVNGYDHIARAALGLTEAPAFNTGDLLVFYTEDFSNLAEDSWVVYAKVTGILDDELTAAYEIIDKADVEELAGGLFVSTPITLDDIETEELQDSVMSALEDSSFTDEALSILATGALQTQSIQNQLLDMGVSRSEIAAMAAQPMAAAGGGGGRTKFVVEDVRVTPSVLVHDRYEDGYGMGLDVSAIFSVSKKVSSGQTTSLKIEVSAYFEQQVAFDLNVDVDTDWKVYLIIPVLKEVTCSVSIDIKSYSNISLSAKTYTVSEQKREAFNDFIEFVRNGKYADALRELNDLRVQRKLGGGQDVIDRIDSILGTLPKINVGGTEYSFEALENELNMTDVSSEFEEVLSAENIEDNKVGIEQLMNRYSELLNSESDWAELLNRELFSKTYHIKILAIKLSVNFIVRADVNLTMGTDLEYEVGKRYNFWVKIFSGTSGSSETDLLDERFGFQFYIMGYIGVKAGFKIDVAIGILSTSIASVGANVEFGPYVKLYGYFLYIYTKERPAGTSDWEVEERAEGAMYLEFGLYLTVKFKAQALKDLIKYEPTLYDGEFPLLTAGDRKNVYDFALAPTSTDILYILDENGDFADGITMELPEAYRNMKTIDLTGGQKAQSIYGLSNYHIRFTNPAFSIDDNGVISFDRSRIAEGDRYAYSDMIMTWKGGKLAFSKYDLAITVPVVWTSYSESEISKLYNVYVAVGNETYGYETVWSGQFNRIQTFDLPTQEEILELIGYDSYVNEDGTNLKYTDTGSYRAEKTTELTVSADTTFYYDIGLKTYSLYVKNIRGKDGIPYANTYTTVYGEPFVQLASLEDTGANDPDSGKFSAFLNLTREGNDDEVFALNTIADMNFYDSYGTSADLSANYTDASRLATFKFQGVSVPDYTVPFRAGTAPRAGDLMEHIAQYFDGTVTIDDISPAVTASENSVTYSVTCSALTEDTPTYPVSFVVLPSEHQSPEDMPQIASVSYPGNSIIFEPKLPTLYGAYLNGWYTDEACTKPFDFSSARMPAGRMTLYARYTQEEGGERVGTDTVFREDTTLYAQWAVTGELTHAQAPVIDWVTKAVKAEVGDISNGLYVDAVSPDGGTLLYRWYRSDTASNENGTPIENAEYYRYVPDTSADGIVYYYCVITNRNTNPKITGNQTATVKTEAIPVYTGTVYVTLDARGGSVSVDKVPLKFYDQSSGRIRPDGNLPIPEKEGYAFMGWYTEKEGGQQMTQYDDFENAVTLYAQWSPDALTPVIADQPDDVDEQLINTEIFLPMTVLAPTDGGALSYQWYRCNEDGTEAQPVEGATESTFVGMADALGTFYYYCVVTNTNKNVSGSKTASVRSDIARVTVAAPTGVEDAMEPQLNWEVMNDATYGKGAQVDDLLYYAFVNDGGVLTYQWYVSSDETSAGTAIDGAAQSTFMPPTEEAGTFYYYCVATNTNAYASNNQMAQSTSSRAKITVVDAQAPVIITQPASAAYREGDTAVPLTVEAEAGEGCILTYQWYENEYPNVEGGVAVAGADQNSFVPATQMEPDEDYMSMYYYFCEITAAYPDGKTLTLYSQVASITVIGSSSGEYIINFDPNGGSVSEISMTTVNQQLLSMPVPERIGYDFDGWYTEKEGGTHVTVSSRIYSGDETLYAHWIDNGRPKYAQSPVITVQPENAQYSAGDPASPLTVQAGVTDGGTLFYQWYRSADGSTTGGTKVGKNSPSFTPDTSAEGTYYYYCVITNTNDAAYYPTATVTTDAACIKVTKAHSHTPVPVVGREATCTEAGSRAYYICGCGMAFEDEGCTKAIADVESWRVIPLLGHSFGEWETVTEATCTQTGKEKRTCSRCEAEETRETEMKAHTWSDSYLGENADPEKHYHVCEICGTRDNGAEHVWNVDAATEQTDRHCTVCGYVAEAQVGHTHKGTLIAGKDATCTEAGSKAYYTCTCGKFFEDEACTKAIADLNGWITIPASGHDFEDGKCVICGAADPDYEPAEPSESTGSGGNVSEGPQTGDSNSLVLWAAVLFVSGGVLVALAVKRKRQKE